jgi:hypothetical protein
MRTSTILAAAAGLLASSALASDVLDLHKDDFHGIVSPEDLMLVEFFARKFASHATATRGHVLTFYVCSLVSLPAPFHPSLGVANEWP